MLFSSSVGFVFFFFNDTATTEIYPLSLHDALPIWPQRRAVEEVDEAIAVGAEERQRAGAGEQFARETLALADRKSTRLNSSHSQISYAVFCLKKKTCRRSTEITASIAAQITRPSQA